MRLVKAGFEIIDEVNGLEMLKRIEAAGRTCYKSESKITDDSCKKFIKMILDRGHESVVEHEKVSVRVVCDRGVTHEIVRHRLASYSQESTRYCDYSGGHLTFIIPNWLEGVLNPGEYTEMEELPLTSDYTYWYQHMLWSEKTYKALSKKGYLGPKGWSPQEARSVLPNSLKTEIVMTANLREWRHFFKLRTASAAHPQMREIAQPMLDKFKELIPVVFDDITY